MSKRGEELLIASLADRWSANANPSSGTTCVANVNSQWSTNTLGAKYKHNLTSLSYSTRNATAAAGTYTLSVRDASIGGTVLAQWEFVVAAAATVQGTFANLDIPGLRGNDVYAEFGTPQTSVNQDITIAGWTDRMVNG